MKKLTTLSINSLTHSYTSIFEVEKGAERLYELTLKKGKIIYTAIDSIQDFVDRLDAHFKNLEDKPTVSINDEMEDTQWQRN